MLLLLEQTSYKGERMSIKSCIQSKEYKEVNPSVSMKHLLSLSSLFGPQFNGRFVGGLVKYKEHISLLDCVDFCWIQPSPKKLDILFSQELMLQMEIVISFSK